MREFLRSPEWKNYWSTRSFPAGYLTALGKMGLAVGGRLRLKYKGREVLPEYISKLDITKLNGFDSGFNSFKCRQVPYIKLGNDIIEWSREYLYLYDSFLEGDFSDTKDPEVYWTLHQFGWLLILILAGDDLINEDKVSYYLNEWINRLGNKSDDQSWRSFSISERLCNWIRILSFFELSQLRLKVIRSMEVQSHHLVRHLESFRDGSTNNHLINNGRALYVVGTILKNAGLANIGRKVLVEESHRQYTPEGFLDEGSSHYQLIFTRAYLEALEVASIAKDMEMVQSLTGNVAKMLRACAFFADERAVEEWKIPFIGDISPDPPPGLFNRTMRFWQLAKNASKGPEGCLTEINISEPWFSGRNDNSLDMTEKNNGWLCNPQSGYYRWDGEHYCVWWHARRAGIRRLHSHNDWGGFQMHINGEPLFIDTGRDTYCSNDGIDGRLTLAHNCVFIDGLEQAPILKRDLYNREYLRDGVDIEWAGDDTRGMLSLRILGYQRLKNPVTHSRIFRLQHKQLNIEDKMDGEGNHKVTVAFHLHPGVILEPEYEGIFLLSTPRGRKARLVLAQGADIEIKKGGSEHSPGGYCCNTYGKKLEITSIFAKYRVTVPTGLEHRILLHM